MAKKENPWYSMSKTGDSAEICIYDQIGGGWFSDGVTSKSFYKDLRSLGDVKEISLRLNSPGGSVFEGMTIYNLLKEHKATIKCYVDGLAASIASVIAMAGDEINIPDNGVIMIHNPKVYAGGESKDLRKLAENLDKIRESAISIYEEKTGLSRDEIGSMMDKESWMYGDEAVKLGFATNKTSAVKMVACLSPELFAHFEHPPIELLQSSLVTTKKEDELMSEPNATVTMSQEDLDALIQKSVASAVNAAVNPQLQKLTEDRLRHTQMRFVELATKGNITPAQAKLFGELATVVMDSQKEISFSDKEDGSDAVQLNAVEVLFKLAEGMKHDVLTEQVAASSENGQSKVIVSSEKWKPDLSAIPYEQKQCPSGYIMDQFIREVLMKNDPGLSYAEAAMLAEKDEHLAVFLNDNDYIPHA